MLSYQHIYHAGNAADVQKHSLLCSVLKVLRGRKQELAYIETHSGRGRYILNSKEAIKTKDFMSGIGLLQKGLDVASSFPFKVSKDFLAGIKEFNNGVIGNVYPGSPLFAHRMIGHYSQCYFFEKHPQEFKALEQLFKKKPNSHCLFQDGYSGALDLSLSTDVQPVVLIDPSYEVKGEYGDVALFTQAFLKKHPNAIIMIWIPMLPKGYHVGLMDQLTKRFSNNVDFHTYEWKRADEKIGMYGSVMAVINGKGIDIQRII